MKDQLTEFTAMMELASFTLAAHVALWGFLSRGDRDAAEDADTAECHDAVLDALSDADRTRTVEALTDRDWREQISVEQAQRLHEEREQARRGWWRN